MELTTKERKYLIYELHKKLKSFTYGYTSNDKVGREKEEGLLLLSLLEKLDVAYDVELTCEDYRRLIDNERTGCSKQF